MTTDQHDEAFAALANLPAGAGLEAPPVDEPRLRDPRTVPARIHHLKAAGKCGALALAALQADDQGEQTLSMKLGSGTHAMITGEPWCVWSQPSKASLDARAKAEKLGKPLPPITMAPRSGGPFDDFVRRNPGHVIMTRKEAESAIGMADALRAHGYASRILFGPHGKFEQRIMWEHLGRARRSTPDLVRLDATGLPDVLAEIKTTRSADPFWFQRDATKLGYLAQLADQRLAIRHHYGRFPRHVYIIAVESPPPHVVQVYELSAAAIEFGERQVTWWQEQLQKYEATNMWTGYSNRIELLEPFMPDQRAMIEAAGLEEPGDNDAA